MSKAHAPLMLHFALVAAITVGGAAWALRSFLPRENEVDASARDRTTDTAPAGARDGGMDGGVGRRPVVVRPRSAWLEPRTIMIGLVVLSAAFAEGTANDWVAVAFVDGHGVPHWAGVLAFTTFLTFMTVGRLAGTRLLDRYGRVAVVRATFVAAAAGSLLVIFGNLWLAYLGTAVWGVGASLGFPVGMSASADDAGRAGARMSVVATIGYTAFIAGPPLLGLLGDHFTVLRALLVVTVLLTGAMFLVPSLRPERGPARVGLVR